MRDNKRFVDDVLGSISPNSIAHLSQKRLSINSFATVVEENHQYTCED